MLALHISVCLIFPDKPYKLQCKTCWTWETWSVTWMQENGKNMFVPSQQFCNHASAYYSEFKSKRYISYFQKLWIFLFTYFIVQQTPVQQYTFQRRKKLFKKLRWCEFTFVTYNTDLVFIFQCYSKVYVVFMVFKYKHLDMEKESKLTFLDIKCLYSFVRLFLSLKILHANVLIFFFFPKNVSNSSIYKNPIFCNWV